MPEINSQDATLNRAQMLAELQKELLLTLNERFSVNLEVFKRYYPQLAKRYAHYSPSRKMEFFCTENGQANLFWVNENEFFYKTETPCDYCAQQVQEQLQAFKLQNFNLALGPDHIGQINHRYVREILNLVNTHKFAGANPLEYGALPNCVMLGCGLGYQLGCLYSQVEVNNLIVIEPDEDVFFACLHTFDWASLLPFLEENHFDLHLIVGKKPADLFDEMLSCYAQSGRFLSGLRFYYVHYESLKIQQCFEVVDQNRAMYMAMLGFFDDQLFGVSHALQAVFSQKRFLRADVELPEAYRKLPWFVVGNGPSLDQDLAFLRKYQDKALIVACGTALETLYHAGIQPDFYGCTERTPEIADTLKVIPDKNFFKKTILLSGEVVHPYVQQYFAHTAIFLKMEECFYALCRQKIPEAQRLRTITMMNPMVGNLGAAAGAFLNFQNIYLFGIDNGTKVGAQNMHSQFNHLYAQWPDYEKRVAQSLAKQYPGNFGGVVATGDMYLLSARTNEELVKYSRVLHKNIQFFNCSDGLYLEGFTPVHSAELIAEFEKHPNIDKAAVHAFFEHKLTQPLVLDKEKILTLLEVEKFRRICDELTEILQQPITNRVEGVNVMHAASCLCYELRKEGDNLLANYLEGSLQYMFIGMINILFHSLDLQACLTPFRHCISLVEHFLADARILYSLQPAYILGPHQQLLKGKVGSDYQDSKAPACPKLVQLVGQNYKVDKLEFVKKYQ